MGKSITTEKLPSIEGQNVFEISVLSYFDDEEGVYYCLAPALDVVGAGQTAKDAQSSFEIVLTEFINSTSSKHSIVRELMRMGWEFSNEFPKKVLAKSPSISDLKNNPDWSGIWAKNPQIDNRRLELAF